MQNMNRIHDPARARAFFEDKVAFTTGPVEVDHMIKGGEAVTIVDVRHPEDFMKGHIPGAINIPQAEWNNPRDLSREHTNVVYCYTQTCHLGANACVVFASKGFPVMEMEGGFAAWESNDLEIEHEPVNRLEQRGVRRR